LKAAAALRHYDAVVLERRRRRCRTVGGAAVAEPAPPALPRRAYPHPRFDPERRPLPPEAWPEAGRQAWAAALAEGDVLEPGGVAAGWRPANRRNIAQGWGHFLAWLARGAARRRRGPAGRVNPERLAGWAAALRARGNAARTVHARVEAVGLFLGAVAPEADRAPVARALRRLRATMEAEAAARRLAKRARLQASHDLLRLGFRLMAETDAEGGGRCGTATGWS
jgi:hypothetical protein